MLHIYVDADGCAVKEEVYKVAARYGLQVTLVANKAMHIPLSPLFKLVVVSGNFDAADDWIAENSGLEGYVVTQKVAGLPVGHGLNAATGNYGDLIADGVSSWVLS